MDNEKPSYYGILPAKVRYAKINPLARLIYCEITALSNVNGFCNAGNEYFAYCYEIKSETVSRCIAVLIEKQFIRVEYDFSGTKITERRMFPLIDPLTKTSTVPLTKKSTDDEKINGAVDEKVKDNITSFNTREREESCSPSEENEEPANTNTESESENKVMHAKYIEAKKQFFLVKEKYFQTLPFPKQETTKNEFWAYRDMVNRAIRDRDVVRSQYETFEERSINYFKSSAEFVVKNRKNAFAFFCNYYEKFSEPQMQFEKPKKQSGDYDPEWKQKEQEEFDMRMEAQKKRDEIEFKKYCEDQEKLNAISNR